MVAEKVLTIGLDGATWDILRPWAEEGRLPHLRRMIENGVWGKLQSTLPPITGPAWASFATGKNPGKHGCFDFVIPNESLSKLKPITRNDIKGVTFYEILEENKCRCILINLPVSYPPRIKSPVITSLLTQGDDFIFPPDLKNEIPLLHNYRILPDMSLRENNRIMEYIEDIVKSEEIRFRCAQELFKKYWDFFFLMFSGTDLVQHVMYDKLSSNKVAKDSPALKLYEEIDGYIGWFTANAPCGTNIFIMSDHGFKAYKNLFNVNEWLRREGYLTTKSRTSSQVARTRGDRERMDLKSKKKTFRVPYFLLHHQKLISIMAPFYKAVVKKALPVRLETNVLEPKISDTIALSTFSVSNFGGIYINDKERFTDGKVEASEYDNLREQIMSKLSNLANRKNGKTVISAVWKKEDIYAGAQLNKGPDILFASNKYLVTTDFRGNLFNSQKDNRHDLYGIFLAYGPDIKQGHEINGAKIYDVAPTILHMFGLPIPKDMDGKVLKETFKEDSEPAQREVKYQHVEREKEKIMEKAKKTRISGKL